MLDASESSIRSDGNEEAEDLLDKLYRELRDETDMDSIRTRGLVYGVQSSYVGFRGIAGPVLRDSWHVGQTFVNDYGRPYSTGMNTYDGFSTITEYGPFSLHVRGEYQHAPAFQGYSFSVANQLSTVLDGVPYKGSNRPQVLTPEGLLPSQNNFRLLEANLSAHVYGHEVSIGKSDAWLSPGLGSSLAWSNNAENIYAFRINRVEPLRIPYVSRLLGNIRYDFFVGSLKGHTAPNSPWAHSEIIGFAPTKNLQLTFQRTIVWGGKGHQPVTLHTFLKGFFDINDTTQAEKFSRNDPGARYSSFTFSYRLPFLRNVATLYTDSFTHDDVFPISAPRRAAIRPGIYLSHLPHAPKVDLRVEAGYTDYVTSRSTGGQGIYMEQVQRQAYTNKGVVMGDWLGREGKGGQAWLNYNLSGNEFIGVQYLRKKNAKDFIQGGTTQNDIRIELTKRIRPNVEVNAYVQFEMWKAPLIASGQQTNTASAFKITWFPALKKSF